VFVPGKPFQTSLMFAGKVGAYPRVEHLSAPALPANIRLGWKGLPGTHALTDYEKL
jgi:hypothetical protein